MFSWVTSIRIKTFTSWTVLCVNITTTTVSSIPFTFTIVVFIITIVISYIARNSASTRAWIWITTINFRVKTKWNWTIVWSTSKNILTLIMRITISFIFRTSVTIAESNFSIAYSGTVKYYNYYNWISVLEYNVF